MNGRPSATAVEAWAGAPDSLLSFVGGALRPTVNIDAPSVRLRIQLTSPQGVTVERSELCAPVSLDAGNVGNVSVTTSSPPPSRVRTPVIRQRIGIDGSVVGIPVTSSSGVAELDQAMLRAAAQGRFLPALLDGRPVEVWWERGRARLVQ